VMVFGLYFPRHRRRDMVVAYLIVNVGLVAITTALMTTGVSAALGFGLFAVLSIIRLRSAELDQPEVAYYFASMTLGLLGGLVLTPAWIGPLLMIGVLVALAIGDHPRLFARYRVQTVTLDAAYTDESQLIARLESLLAARVHRISVRRVDLVEATTVVEVRYERPGAESMPMVSPIHPDAP
jgi:Domain of unknown function (DUF4956)